MNKSTCDTYAVTLNHTYAHSCMWYCRQLCMSMPTFIWVLHRLLQQCTDVSILPLSLCQCKDLRTYLQPPQLHGQEVSVLVCYNAVILALDLEIGMCDILYICISMILQWTCIYDVKLCKIQFLTNLIMSGQKRVHLQKAVYAEDLPWILQHTSLWMEGPFH